MKKYLITCCIILCLAFVGGFLTSHFTSNSDNVSRKQHEELQNDNAALQSAIEQAHR